MAECPLMEDTSIQCPSGHSMVQTRLLRGELLPFMPPGEDLVRSLSVLGVHLNTRDVSFELQNPFGFEVSGYICMYVQYESRVEQFAASEPVWDRCIGIPPPCASSPVVCNEDDNDDDDDDSPYTSSSASGVSYTLPSKTWFRMPCLVHIFFVRAGILPLLSMSLFKTVRNSTGIRAEFV